MMKLRHLFDNPALAEMLLRNWDYDESSLEMFRYYRVSANAIYPFRRNGETCFLRFCAATEKSRQAILAELEFIHYLRAAHYNALEPVPGRSGEELVQKSTPWGDYFAGVFKRVTGEQISETGFEDEIVFEFGAALGQLHNLSSQYAAPQTKRWTHADVLDWIEAILSQPGMETLPLDELRLLRAYFAGLPADPQTYGLIHYDFEPDNVFYDPLTRSCSVIDFDDAMYHWYVMDIQQALDSLADEIPGYEFAHKQAVFVLGYRSRFEIDTGLFAAMPAFGRFASLYRYARIARSVQERWDNEPEWLVELRGKLAGAMARCMQSFGQPV